MNGETDQNYYKRLEAMSHPAQARKGGLEFADDDEIHVAGPVGKKGATEFSGKIVPREHISDRKCPYCRRKMFVAQDEMGEQKFRCEHHGVL